MRDKVDLVTIYSGWHNKICYFCVIVIFSSFTMAEAENTAGKTTSGKIILFKELNLRLIKLHHNKKKQIMRAVKKHF